MPTPLAPLSPRLASPVRESSPAEISGRPAAQPLPFAPGDKPVTYTISNDFIKEHGREITLRLTHACLKDAVSEVPAREDAIEAMVHAFTTATKFDHPTDNLIFLSCKAPQNGRWFNAGFTLDPDNDMVALVQMSEQITDNAPDTIDLFSLQPEKEENVTKRKHPATADLVDAMLKRARTLFSPPPATEKSAKERQWEDLLGTRDHPTSVPLSPTAFPGGRMPITIDGSWMWTSRDKISGPAQDLLLSLLTAYKDKDKDKDKLPENGVTFQILSKSPSVLGCTFPHEGKAYRASLQVGRDSATRLGVVTDLRIIDAGDAQRTLLFLDKMSGECRDNLSMMLDKNIGDHLKALQEELDKDPNKSAEQKADGPDATDLLSRLQQNMAFRHFNFKESSIKTMSATFAHFDAYRKAQQPPLKLEKALATLLKFDEDARTAKVHEPRIGMSYLHALGAICFPCTPARQRIQALLNTNKALAAANASPQIREQYLNYGSAIDAHLARQELHFADVCRLEGKGHDEENRERLRRFLKMQDEMMTRGDPNLGKVLKALRVALHPLKQDTDLEALINGATLQNGKEVGISTKDKWRVFAPPLAEALAHGGVDVQVFVKAVLAAGEEGDTTAKKLQSFKDSKQPFASSTLTYTAIKERLGAGENFDQMLNRILHTPRMAEILQPDPGAEATRNNLMSALNQQQPPTTQEKTLVSLAINNARNSVGEEHSQDLRKTSPVIPAKAGIHTAFA